MALSRVGVMDCVTAACSLLDLLPSKPPRHYLHHSMGSRPRPPSGRRPCLYVSVCVFVSVWLDGCSVKLCHDATKMLGSTTASSTHIALKPSLSHFHPSHTPQTAFMDDGNGNVVVAASQHHGRGLFGTRAFMPNEVRDGGWRRRGGREVRLRTQFVLPLLVMAALTQFYQSI